jgi:restriction system protein
MPPRKKQDGLDLLTDVFALLPWWVPFLLAVAAWLVLPLAGPSLYGGPAWKQVWGLIGLAVGLLLLVSGVLAQVTKSRRRGLVAQSASLDALQALSWRQFEQLCAEAYRRRGYSVAETARGADGGVDLVLRRADQRIFVQCKHWSVARVDVRRVRELFGVMHSEAATGGILICSGTYTSAAREFARGKAIELVDGPGLLKLLEPSRGSLAGR